MISFLAGEPDAIEQLTSEHDGEVSSELLAAAARTSGPHGLVVATPVQTMLPVVALLPKLTNTTPQITAQAAEYLVSLKTASISETCRRPMSQFELELNPRLLPTIVETRESMDHRTIAGQSHSPSVFNVRE